MEEKVELKLDTYNKLKKLEEYYTNNENVLYSITYNYKYNDGQIIRIVGGNKESIQFLTNEISILQSENSKLQESIKGIENGIKDNTTFNLLEELNKKWWFRLFNNKNTIYSINIKN